MSSSIIVIGAGHNGLVAATRLARAGRKVVMVEARNVVGGLGRGEVFSEGFSTTGLLHDATGFREEVVGELNLDKFGLQRRTAARRITLPAEGAQSIHIQGGRVDGVSSDELLVVCRKLIIPECAPQPLEVTTQGKECISGSLPVDVFGRT